MKKHSSLLDYSYPGLSPDIYQADGTLLPYHKDFVFKLLNSFYTSYKLKNPEAWVLDVTNIGSLTTNKYLRSSDFDCHVIVDIDAFIKTNMSKASKEEAIEYLDNARKEWDRAKILLPFGEHPLELYFENQESPSNTKAVGRYSLISNTWLKEPVFFEQDDDYEVSKKKIVEEAIELANELDASFGSIRRDIKRIEELKEVANAWPANTRKIYIDKIEEKLNSIEEEIEKSIAVRKELIDERHQKQDAFSDNEIKFKYLARFFYFYVIDELKTVLEGSGGEITETDLPVIENVVGKVASKHDDNKDLLIDFDGTIAEKAEYPEIGKPMPGVQEAFAKFKELGYSIIIYTCRTNHKGAVEQVEKYLDENEIPYDMVFEGEKPHAKFYIDDKAIHFDSWEKVTEKVEHSKKTASLRIIAYERKLWFDPSGQMYEVGSSGSHADWILNNAKMLKKEYGFNSSKWHFEDDGYIPYFEDLNNALIKTGWARIGDTNIGWGLQVADLRRIPTYLMDYVGEFTERGGVTIEDVNSHWVQVGAEEFATQGQKAVNRALQHKRLQESSLHRVAMPIILRTIDPKTFKRKEPYALFIGTSNYGKAGKYDMFNVYGQHPMINENNQLPTVGLETLIKEQIPVIGKEPRAGNAQPAQDISSIFKQASLQQAAALVTDPSHEDRQGPPYALFAFVQPGLPEYGIPDMEMYNIFGDHPRFGSTVTKKTVEDLGLPIKQAKQAQTKKIKQGEYGALMALVPHNIAQEIVEWGVRNIPDSAVFSSEDNPRLGRELESHITIKYGLLTEDAKNVRRFFNNTKPFKAKLGKIRHFEPPEMDFDVVTVEVISDDLNEMNEIVTEKFDCAEGLVSDDYHPHITISYVKRGTGKDFIGATDFEGIEVELDTVIFSPAKGNRTYFKMDVEAGLTIIWKLNKKAGYDIGYWVDPKGNTYDCHGEGLIHNEWICANLELLKNEYGLKIPEDLEQQSFEYFKSIQEDDGDNIDQPFADSVWREMIQSGWVRVGDSDNGGLGVELNSLRAIPSFMDALLAQDLRDGDYIRVEGISDHTSVSIEYPFKNLQQSVNKALSSPTKTAAFTGPIFIWLSPDGEEYDTPQHSHGAWVEQNMELLKTKYNLKKLSPAFGGDETSDVDWLISKGWTRVTGYLPSEIDLNVADINNVPQAAENYVWAHKPEVVIVEDLNHNDDSFDQEEYSKGLSKRADFLPSFVQAPDNDWQFSEGGPDKEIPVDPDAQSDEQTDMAPCTTGKPRKMDMWKSIWHMIKSPFSKKDVEKESAADTEQEQIEKNELGEDETLLEYSKGFKDLNRINTNKPKTTWDAPDKLPNQHSPYSALPVTLDVVTNPDNENWRYPYKFTRRPIGDQSNQGDVTQALEDMFQNMKASLNKEAEILEIDSANGTPFSILINPTANEARGLFNRSQERQLRYTYDTDGTCYLWDAYYGTHFEVIKALHDMGFPIDETAAGEFVMGERDLSVFGSLGKRASIEEVNGIKVLVNPTPNELQAIFTRSKNEHLRGLIDPHTGDTYVWDGWQAEHNSMIRYYGLDIDWENDDGTYIRHIGGPNDIEQFFQIQQDVKNKLGRKKKASWEGGWIDPKGKFYSTGDHQNFIEGNPAMFGITEDDRYNMNDEQIFDAGYRAGWTRVRNFGNVLLVQAAQLRYAQNADAFIYENLDSGIRVIELVLEEERKQYTASVKDFKAEGWDAFSQVQSLRAASLKLKSIQKNYALYVGGLLMVRTMTMGKAQKILQERYPEALKSGNYEIRPEKYEQALFREALYSNTYTDEQGEQFYNEQHMNNTDEEPYVNHDQRDYPYGMHDSPENTDSGIGWAKDNTRQVVLLDQLLKPCYRQYAPGLPEYQVFFFDTLPMSDGSEV